MRINNGQYSEHPPCTISSCGSEAHCLRRFLLDGVKQPVLPAPPIERRFSHIAAFLGFRQRDLTGFPLLQDSFKVIRDRQHRSAEMNATRTGSRYALSRRFYILAFDCATKLRIGEPGPR